MRAAKGKVRLVKIDIDKNPELAQQLRIQSVPTVFAFFGGQPVTGFAGAQPESQIKALVDRLVAMAAGGAERSRTSAAGSRRPRTFAERGDWQTAASVYREILGDDPGHAEALGGLAGAAPEPRPARRGAARPRQRAQGGRRPTPP